jgi:uncharacterized membrane protein YcaP (DUF421 family)
LGDAVTTLIHAVVGYFFLVLIVRVLARRPGAQMTPFEFVLIFLIGGVIILTTVDSDDSATNCFGAVMVICLMHRMVSYMKQRFPRVGAWVDGAPVVVLEGDHWQADNARQMRVDDADVMAAARAKGLRSLDQIKYAVVERNGGISIIKK